MGPTSWTDSPYVGICIRPRATIRAIVDSDPDPDGRAIKLVLITAVVAAVTNAIRSYRYNPTAFTIANKPIPVVPPHGSHLVSLWGLVIWPLLAVPFLYLGGALLRWSGALLGGTAKAVEVRAAIGWSSVLSIGLYLISFVLSFLVTPSQRPTSLSMNAMLASWRPMWPSLIILAPLWLWEWIVRLQSLGEVHRFSAWRALSAQLIGLLLVLGAILVAVVVFGTIIRIFAVAAG
jgi:Yip1 domain